MDPIPFDTTRSLRRSRLRERLLVTLSSLGEAYAGQLSHHAGIPVTRVKWLLYGRPPYYREDLSLIALGLAREKRTRGGRGFEITPKGRRKARSITSRWARQARVRAVARDVAEGQVKSHLTSAAGSDAESPDSA